MSRDNSLCNSESKRLANKFKKEEPVQFQTLVKMHLSFVLDLNADETDNLQEKSKLRQNKWGFVPVSFSKKTRTPAKQITDSVPLTYNIENQIRKLIQHLTHDENLKQEGIFRRSGRLTRQQELKSLLTQGDPLNLNESVFSVHECASVLKSFLSELPEPLLTDAYYPAYCQIAEFNKNEIELRMLRALQLLLLLLPSENRRLMKDLMGLLHKTSNLASYNRMNAENLATLFTPHLLCPRKLTPEAFHATAQNLSCIIVFMINEGLKIFDVPQNLTTDIKAYYDRKRLTPNHLLEQSITEVKTVYSFVDHERTAQENVENPTETALAQLYAHIQALPESNKKKKLIKQFNKENGYGTPRTKSLSTSIKKHIFTKCQKGKDVDDTLLTKYEKTGAIKIESPDYKTPLSRIPEKQCLLERIPTLKSRLENSVTSSDKLIVMPEQSPCSSTSPSLSNSPDDDEIFSTPLPAPRFIQNKHLQDIRINKNLLTSTPATSAICLHKTPSPPSLISTSYDQDVSPITRSARRMPKSMQEAMITPRSRKPVMALSGSNLYQLGNSALQTTEIENWSCPSELTENSNKALKSYSSQNGSSSLSSPFKDYLFSRSILTNSPVDLSFCSTTGDFVDHSDLSTGTTTTNESFPCRKRNSNEMDTSRIRSKKNCGITETSL